MDAWTRLAEVAGPPRGGTLCGGRATAGLEHIWGREIGGYVAGELEMTEAEEVGGAPRKQARRRKPTVTTATGLGLHLGLSRQRVVQLADEGVIGRLDDGGFDETACRLKYLDWLRSSERRSARSAVEAEFLRAKTVALEIRTEERLGNLVPRQVLEDAIDIIVGMYRAEFGGLPASFTRDVSERRRL